MIEENARVVFVHLDENENSVHSLKHKVTVESEIKSSCSGCKQVDNCGSGQVAKAFPKTKLSLNLETNLPAKVGDIVVIGLSDKHLLMSAWQVYLWPLLGLIIASVLGQWFVDNKVFNHELLAIALGFLGGYLGFYLARHQQKSGKYCESLIPQILRIQSSPISAIDISD